MPDFNWRSPKAYTKMQNTDPTGIAWECLRRNPEYQENFDALKNPLDPVPSEFRRNWGLSFRG